MDWASSIASFLKGRGRAASIVAGDIAGIVADFIAVFVAGVFAGRTVWGGMGGASGCYGDVSASDEGCGIAGDIAGVT